MIDRLEAILEKYTSIEKELTKPEVLQDIKKTTELSKEMRDLEDVVRCYQNYKKVINYLTETEDM